MSQRHSDVTLDLSGLLCPLPVLRARKGLQAMKPGQVLCVTATDPMAAIDMPHFCHEQGHRLIASDKVNEGAGQALRFWIEAGGS